MANDGNSCLLQSINLYNLVDNKFTDEACVDYNKFERLIRLSIKMMNQTQDYGYDMQPLDKHRKNIDDWRSIGLGIFGLADMFVAMKVKYGSNESIELVSKLFDFMNHVALDESCEEAKKYGTYGAYDWEKQKQSPIIKALRLTESGCALYDRISQYGLRNSSILSIAPTGCQKKEMLVATSEGLLRLDELVDINGIKWQERGDLTAIQEKTDNIITKGFINGYAHTKKIRLYSGIELESTFNHQYRVIRDGNYQWCRADELQLGDIVPSRIGYYNKEDYCKLVHPQYEDYNGISKKVIFPDTLNEKFAFILGCYFANGSTKKNGGNPKYKVIRFAMNTNKEDDINKLMEYCYDVFGVRPRVNVPKDNRHKNCVDMYIASVNLCNLFAVNGLIKGKSYEISIPRLIRQSPRSVIESFLDGYYMCDGSHSGNNKYIDTVSFQLAQELAVIFRALGTDIKILTYSDRSKSIGNRPLYRVYFGGRFSLGHNYTANRDRKNMLLQVKDILGADFIFDEIISIEDSTNMTYDIEVNNEHYYLANGTVSHNTVSMFMGKLSGGCEPLFKLWYDRTTHQGEKKNFTFRIMSRSVEDLINYLGLTQDISKEELIKQCPWLVESHEILPIDRVRLQAVMQEYVDNSISSTVNLPNSATWQDIYDIYISAWKQGCKGITVFRDGCSRAAILGVKEPEHTFKYDSIIPVSRRGEKEVDGKTFRLKTACVDKFYIHVNNTDNGDIFEVFANPSSGCQANISTITRLVSMALRSGVKVEEIIKELKSAKCAGCQALRNKGEKDIELSCGNAIATALELSYAKELKTENKDGLLVCPQCGERTLRLEAKCCVCPCGYSRCD